MLKTRIMDGFRKKLQETMNRARKAMIDQARMERQRESVAMLRRRNVAAAKEGVGKDMMLACVASASGLYVALTCSHTLQT